MQSRPSRLAFLGDRRRESFPTDKDCSLKPRIFKVFLYLGT